MYLKYSDIILLNGVRYYYWRQREVAHGQSIFKYIEKK